MKKRERGWRGERASKGNIEQVRVQCESERKYLFLSLIASAIHLFNHNLWLNSYSNIYCLLKLSTLKFCQRASACYYHSAKLIIMMKVLRSSPCLWARTCECVFSVKVSLWLISFIVGSAWGCLHNNNNTRSLVNYRRSCWTLQFTTWSNSRVMSSTLPSNTSHVSIRPGSNPRSCQLQKASIVVT